MHNGISEERLAELRQMRDGIKRQPYSDWGFSYQQDIADAVDEIDRLRAEVERLRGTLCDIAYNTSTSIPLAAPPETFIVGQLRSCIGRAARALNPEAATG